METINDWYVGSLHLQKETKTNEKWGVGWGGGWGGEDEWRVRLRQDPLETILVIFGRRALFFFVWKLLEKYEKWQW